MFNATWSTIASRTVICYSVFFLPFEGRKSFLVDKRVTRASVNFRRRSTTGKQIILLSSLQAVRDRAHRPHVRSSAKRACSPAPCTPGTRQSRRSSATRLVQPALDTWDKEWFAVRADPDIDARTHHTDCTCVRPWCVALKSDTRRHDTPLTLAVYRTQTELAVQLSSACFHILVAHAQNDHTVRSDDPTSRASTETDSS